MRFRLATGADERALGSRSSQEKSEELQAPEEAPEEAVSSLLCFYFILLFLIMLYLWLMIQCYFHLSLLLLHYQENTRYKLQQTMWIYPRLTDFTTYDRGCMRNNVVF